MLVSVLPVSILWFIAVLTRYMLMGIYIQIYNYGLIVNLG